LGVLNNKILNLVLLLIHFVGSLVAEFSIDPFLLLAAIVPIKSYSNAEDEKDKILKENQNKSGIYK